MTIPELILYESRKYDINLGTDDIIVLHPLTQSAFMVTIQGELIDVRTKSGREKMYINMKDILSVKKLEDILEVISKPYQLNFLLLLYLESKISLKEMGEKYIDIYSSLEFPSRTPNLIREIYENIKELNLLDAQNLKLDSKGLLKIYRGQEKENGTFLSWTTDREKAKWFATRFSGKGYILETDIPLDKIWFTIDKRGENEVVIKPDVEISYIKKRVEIPTL